VNKHRVFLVAGLAIAGLSQSANAQDPGAVASERCWRAAERDASAMMGGGNPKRLGQPFLSQESNAETRVSGTGEVEGRQFSWSCIYNIRNGATYGISVQPSNGYVAPGRPGYNPGYNQGYNPGYQPGYPGSAGSDWNRGVPPWAIGKWEGYNQKNRSSVRLNIDVSGNVRTNVNGIKGNATIKDGTMRQGLARYRIERTRDGFVTIQIGDERNVTYYTRR
jgi:hypothetical protein